ncbi:MAG: DUF2344 domain-containing protein [Ruminococcus sp.]|nr:DUF2344 domain-containing protein [Ruminococcus sp.]
MLRLRAVFKKTGRSVYISHLDLNRCMLRIFRRSKLPVWYTEGFNPHPYYSFALALSLGFESECEIMDFNITEDISLEEVKERLNAVMPEGMGVVSVSEQKKKITEIAKAEYCILIDAQNTEELIAEFNKFMAQDEINVEKKTKKGIKTVDIKPAIEVVSIVANEGKVLLDMRLPAGTKTNYNPTLVIDAFREYAENTFEILKIKRTGILCENNEIFL